MWVLVSLEERALPIEKMENTRAIHANGLILMIVATVPAKSEKKVKISESSTC